MKPRILLEICVETLAAARAAAEGGADRLELCSRLDLDGLTPGDALLREAVRLGLPCVAMIRPRAGDFTAGPDERATMRAQIDAARAAGASGVALGLLRRDGRIDIEGTAELASHARHRDEAGDCGPALELCFHRAFDRAPDPAAALDQIVALGFDRVLTSGGAASAALGLPRLAALVERAAGRIAVVPAGRVRAGDAAEILRASRARQLHSSAGMPPEGDASLVRALRDAIDAVPAAGPA